MRGSSSPGYTYGQVAVGKMPVKSNTTDRAILVSLLILVIICLGLLVLIHNTNNTYMYPSSRDSPELASLRKIERAINDIRIRMHLQSTPCVNVNDDEVDTFYKWFKVHQFERQTCDVPKSTDDTIPTDHGRLADHQDLDKPGSDAGKVWLVMSWVRWIAVWIYRLILGFCITMVVLFPMTVLVEHLNIKDKGLWFTVTTCFVFVSSLSLITLYDLAIQYH